MLLTPWGTPNVSPKQKTTEEQGVGACSLACSTLEGYKGVMELRDGTRKNWQASITHKDLHKTNTRWLVHSWNTFGAKMSHEQTRTHKSHHSSDLGEATTFPLIVYFAPLHGGHIQMVFFPSGSPEIPQLGLPRLWGPITLRANLQLQSKVIALVKSFPTICHTLSAHEEFGSITNF